VLPLWHEQVDLDLVASQELPEVAGRRRRDRLGVDTQPQRSGAGSQRKQGSALVVDRWADITHEPLVRTAPRGSWCPSRNRCIWRWQVRAGCNRVARLGRSGRRCGCVVRVQRSCPCTAPGVLQLCLGDRRRANWGQRMAGFLDGIRQTFGTEHVVIIHNEGMEDEVRTPVEAHIQARTGCLRSRPRSTKATS